MDGLSAAHQTLPLGTRIRVENRDNGRSLELRVNDRGPFARGRILDLSRGAARDLGVIGPGTAIVTITVLEVGGDAVEIRGGCAVVQIASFRDRAAARRYVRELQGSAFALSIEEHRGLFRVVSGPYTDAGDAMDARAALGGFIRRCEPM
jgi:rare lipoprotein A